MRSALLLTLLLGSCLKELPEESKSDDSVVSTDDSDSPADDSEVQGEMCIFYVDGDSDGFGDVNAPVDALCDSPPEGLVSDSSDCDDFNVGVHPGAAEVCDTLDNDCDGEVDGPDAIGAVPFSADTDGDGYGDAAVSVMACEVPEGYVTNGDDCDDFNAAINPAADELCDGVDNNCDQQSDGEDAVDQGTWYLDSDADRYGDPSTAVTSCFTPGNDYVTNGDDCDDTNTGVNPSITGWASAPYGINQWDYNCDTVEEQQYTDQGACTVESDGTCTSVAGFVDAAIPACGDSAPFISGCDADCLPQTSASRRQKCR